MSTKNHFASQLIKHLSGGEAFLPITEVLRKITFEKLGERPQGLPYSFYELFYHITYTQNDILNYCQKTNYEAPSWPEDYWPEKQAPDGPAEWEAMKESYLNDRKELIDLISAKNLDLSDHVPSQKAHSLFREVLLVIEHTAYHTGQLVIVLRHLGLHSS